MDEGGLVMNEKKKEQEGVRKKQGMMRQKGRSNGREAIEEGRGESVERYASVGCCIAIETARTTIRCTG